MSPLTGFCWGTLLWRLADTGPRAPGWLQQSNTRVSVLCGDGKIILNAVRGQLCFGLVLCVSRPHVQHMLTHYVDVSPVYRIHMVPMKVLYSSFYINYSGSC